MSHPQNNAPTPNEDNREQGSNPLKWIKIALGAIGIILLIVWLKPIMKERAEKAKVEKTEKEAKEAQSSITGIEKVATSQKSDHEFSQTIPKEGMWIEFRGYWKWNCTKALTIKPKFGPKVTDRPDQMNDFHFGAGKYFFQPTGNSSCDCDFADSY